MFVALWIEKLSVAACKRSWMRKVLIFFHSVFTCPIKRSYSFLKELFVHLFSCLMPVLCKDPKKCFFNSFWNCYRHLNFVVLLWVNNSRYQIIFPTLIFANYVCCLSRIKANSKRNASVFDHITNIIWTL